MIGFLVGLLALAGLIFYLGFASGERTVWRWLSEAACVICGPLLAVVVYAAWQEHAAVAQLASFIDPYTSISVLTWAPSAPSGETRHWVATTPDPPARVASFYEDPVHRPGWDLLEHGTSLILLKRDQACLSIMINRQPGERGGSSVVYALVPKC